MYCDAKCALDVVFELGLVAVVVDVIVLEDIGVIEEVKLLDDVLDIVVVVVSINTIDDAVCILVEPNG